MAFHVNKPIAVGTALHPISKVLRVLKETGRFITRSNFQQSRRRGLTYATVEGIGRTGDGYDDLAICQIALYFDLTQKLHFHQETCSRIAYSSECQKFLRETLDFSTAAQIQLRANTLRGLPAQKPEGSQMDLVFYWNIEWGMEVEYLRGAEDLLRFQGKRSGTRIALVVNVSQLVWEISAATNQIV
jgi:hypothetical protein